MSEASPRYLAYMLRIWQSGAGGRLNWRASLESPHTGERLAFTTLEALCDFLHERTVQGALVSDSEGTAAPDADESTESLSRERNAWPSRGSDDALSGPSAE